MKLFACSLLLVLVTSTAGATPNREARAERRRAGLVLMLTAAGLALLTTALGGAMLRNCVRGGDEATFGPGCIPERPLELGLTIGAGVLSIAGFAAGTPIYASGASQAPAPPLALTFRIP